MAQGKLISVVVPVYCEEEVIEETYRRLTEALRALPGHAYELVFVDDGSTDGTGAIIRRLAAVDPRLKVIAFSRNFGHQMAITAGLRRACGDAVVTIDADLQDPPSLIPRMVELWGQGHHVVYGKRIAREGETWFKRATASFFYRLLNRLAAIDIPEDTGDFRLVDRRVVQELNRLQEHSRFLRGLVTWVGFRQVAIEYVREPRRAGTTKYPFAKMMRFAWDGIVAFSNKPLRVAMNVGLLAIGVAFVVLVYGLSQYWAGNVVRGWTSTIVTILFLGGIQLFTIGVIGEYVGRMYEDIKNRPLYLVAEEINFDRE